MRVYFTTKYIITQSVIIFKEIRDFFRKIFEGDYKMSNAPLRLEQYDTVLYNANLNPMGVPESVHKAWGLLRQP